MRAFRVAELQGPDILPTTLRAETLSDAGLIERRVADLGDTKNVLHLRLSSVVLQFLGLVSQQMQNCPEAKRKTVLRHAADKRIKSEDFMMAPKTLIGIAKRVREDPDYGKYRLVNEVAEAFDYAAERATMPTYNPYPVKTTPNTTTAQKGGFAPPSTAQSGVFREDETPNKAGIIKMEGKLFTGESIEGESKPPLLETSKQNYDWCEGISVKETFMAEKTASEQKQKVYQALVDEFGWLKAFNIANEKMKTTNEPADLIAPKKKILTVQAQDPKSAKQMPETTKDIRAKMEAIAATLHHNSII